MNRAETRAAKFAKRPPGAQRGFSLIELLIVVAVILIIAAIAIPNLMRAKMAANEAGAAESVRTIITGETTYMTGCPDVGFSPSLKELNTGTICASGKNIIDSVLGGADPSFKSGYTFVYTPIAGVSTNTQYTIVALPITVGITGGRGFYSDQIGVIRYTLDGTAPTPTSSALQ